eukprot:TRINITY_DN8261_c0_g2_i1.p1 TRINITY_DN8261_c0_g2~~TRINITY_DN8261_c0_g2_i1.p1  ORF type:complete len:194 (+),score=18.87 TRINITY_DN8261_c0_g2_i1:121-702(+)
MNAATDPAFEDLWDLIGRQSCSGSCCESWVSALAHSRLPQADRPMLFASYSPLVLSFLPRGFMSTFAFCIRLLRYLWWLFLRKVPPTHLGFRIAMGPHSRELAQLLAQRAILTDDLAAAAVRRDVTEVSKLAERRVLIEEYIAAVTACRMHPRGGRAHSSPFDLPCVQHLGPLDTPEAAPPASAPPEALRLVG